MALIVVGSVKGAPGASTVALGVAACWPAAPAMLVEADPSGGDAAARFGHAENPGLASAATAARHGDGDDMAAHVQRLALGVKALLGPASADVASAALAAMSGVGASVAARSGVTVADVGRLSAGSPAGWLLEAADVLLLVVWPRLDCLAHVAARIAGMTPQERERTRLVLRGSGDYPSDEIGRDVGVPVVATVPEDRLGAGVLSGRFTPAKGWRRLRLPRALTRLATDLAASHAAVGAQTTVGPDPFAVPALSAVGGHVGVVVGDPVAEVAL